MNLPGFIELSTELRQSISTEQAWHYQVIPKRSVAGELELYISPSNKGLKEELEVVFGKTIHLHFIEDGVILETLNRYYQKPVNNNSQESVFSFSDDFISNIIIEARSLNSSDIHFEPFENSCRIRLRIDGQLIERYSIEKKEYPVLINKIKIKSNLDIAEKRLPQDGRIFFTQNNTKIDLRVSIMPTLFGEKAVLRILSKDTTFLDLSDLGFSENQLEDYKSAIYQPYGIVLISGPTGSGKTTSLYATLKMLNKKSSNILTIEDPIEYTIEGINQVQLNESVGLSFAKALRTFLRQDPDIIMLGEIRDDETAQMAIRASLTGHLVLSTIHTNTALGIISRLIDMGVPPFLIKSTLNLAVSQRLVRLLCENCKKKTVLNRQNKNFTLLEKHGVTELFEPCGCNSCYHTGYKGRKAIYEVIPVTEELFEKTGQSANDIKAPNYQTLTDSAIELLKKGVTSYNEIYPILISKQTN